MDSPVSLRKSENGIRVENITGNLLAIVTKFDTKFFEPVTPEELSYINLAAQNFPIFLNNVIEE